MVWGELCWFYIDIEWWDEVLEVGQKSVDLFDVRFLLFFNFWSNGYRGFVWVLYNKVINGDFINDELDYLMYNMNEKVWYYLSKVIVVDLMNEVVYGE